MNKPIKTFLISIVIPIHNRGKQLAKTLQSIDNQSFRPIELILVDNGSQDNSLEICKQFKEKQSNLFFKVQVIQEPKPGANAARNAGMSKATGDYLMFFDSDDLMYPECLLSIASNLEKNGFPGAIAYPCFIRMPKGNLTKRPHIYSVDPADQLFDTLIPTHGFCIKKEALAKVGEWDEQLQRWQDLEYGFRILQHVDNLVWITEKPIYEVIRHPDSISGNSYSSDHEKMYASLEKIGLSILSIPASKEKERQKRALCYRACTIASQIRKEGDLQLAQSYLDKAINALPDSRRCFATWFLRFQFWYEGNGGRGLWRMARLML